MQLNLLWLLGRNDSLNLSDKTVKGLLPFVATYFNETGFSDVAVMKTKYRPQFLVERELRLSISSVTPMFDKPCCEKEAHPLH
jgi:hypothetical protein